MVFANAIFEIKSEVPVDSIPGNKSELVRMYREGLVVPFHHKFCSACHTVPRAKEWYKDLNNTGKKKKINYLSLVNRHLHVKLLHYPWTFFMHYPTPYVVHLGGAG